MSRAAQLLLLLVVSWLASSAPFGRLALVTSEPPAAFVEEERARAGVEHAVLESATLQVARAPLLARVPAPLPELGVDFRSARAPSSSPPDLREELRRVQARRRVPRLGPAEPPWCRATLS